MKTYVKFDRTIRLNGSNITFTEGAVEKASKIRRLNQGRLPYYSHLIEKATADVILNNKDIEACQKDNEGKTLLEIAEGDQKLADEFQLCIDHLLSLGFAMEDIVVHRNDILTRKDSEGRPGWVGTKIQNLQELFVGRNGKPVALTNWNWISTNTFLRRVEKSGALFAHGQF